MRRREVVVPTVAAAALLALATPALPAELRITAVLGAAIAVGLGQHLHVPGASAVGLLAVVLGVATGPASTTGPLPLLAWVAATWGVVLAASGGLGTRWPPPRDGRTRWRLAAGVIGCLGLSVSLVLVATVVDRAGPGWPVVGGLALVAALALATSRPGTGREDA